MAQGYARDVGRSWLKADRRYLGGGGGDGRERMKLGSALGTDEVGLWEGVQVVTRELTSG